jgi:hypothetical protein
MHSPIVHTETSFGYVLCYVDTHRRANKWVAAQNITETLCEHPIRDITHITPIVTGVSGGLAIFAVVVRTIIAGAGIATDDILVIVALITALPMGILEFFMAADGFGKDIWNIPSEKVYTIVKVRESCRQKFLPLSFR